MSGRRLPSEDLRRLDYDPVNGYSARRSRNQTQLQRLKPAERNFVSAGLKPGPPRRSENATRGATNRRITSTGDATMRFFATHSGWRGIALSCLVLAGLSAAGLSHSQSAGAQGSGSAKAGPPTQRVEGGRVAPGGERDVVWGDTAGKQ